MRNLSWNTLKHRIDLDAVEQDLGIQVLHTSGGERIARCPLPGHGGADRNPAFAINPQKLAYNCFKCGGGSIQWLVQEMEGLNKDEALLWLAQRTKGYEHKDADAVFKAVQRTLYFSEEPTPAALPWFPKSMLEPFLQHQTDYFQNRGISHFGQQLLKLGYDPAYTKFNPRTGTEYVGEAAIIPHFFEGQLVGYQARWIGDRPEGLPRYDNTKNFPKAETLYNWDMARRHAGPVHVVESPLTAAYLVGLGLMAVATFGSPPSKEQVNLLRHFESLTLAFDNDKAGEKGTRFVISNLKKSVDLWWSVPVLSIEKGNLLDLGEAEGAAAVHEHLRLQLPGSLYDYYMLDQEVE